MCRRVAGWEEQSSILQAPQILMVSCLLDPVPLQISAYDVQVTSSPCQAVDLKAVLAGTPITRTITVTVLEGVSASTDVAIDVPNPTAIGYSRIRAVDAADPGEGAFC